MDSSFMLGSCGQTPPGLSACCDTIRIVLRAENISSKASRPCSGPLLHSLRLASKMERQGMEEQTRTARAYHCRTFISHLLAEPQTAAKTEVAPAQIRCQMYGKSRQRYLGRQCQRAMPKCQMDCLVFLDDPPAESL